MIPRHLETLTTITMEMIVKSIREKQAKEGLDLFDSDRLAHYEDELRRRKSLVRGKPDEK